MVYEGDTQNACGFLSIYCVMCGMCNDHEDVRGI